jgi:hypothetical protein
MKLAPILTLTSLGITEKKWIPNKVDTNYFEKSKPLLDNTHTPRSRERAISLDRNYSKKKWVPPRTALGEFKIRQKKKYGG